MTDKSMTLKERFGQIPKGTGLIAKMREHQGWWRANVLNEMPGRHPKKSSENVCNTILNGQNSNNNFLSSNIVQIVNQTLEQRTDKNLGIIEQDRLFNNLLSSQPLCFNFFGELEADKNFGLTVLKNFYPDLTELDNVYFEFAPTENYTGDSSAFDVAFNVKAGKQNGIIGFECKYTDTFSYKPNKSEIFYGDKGNKNHDTYIAIYEKANKKFNRPYYEFVKSKKFNQLFRNQLIAESLLLNKKYDFVRTGLFCYQNDVDAIKTGSAFRKMLTKSDDFQIITYSDFISKVQQLNLDWRLREWTMMLWARYFATSLSDATTSKL